ncbi:MAG: hypothetical protein KA144_03400 [Xanthomonadaceae bacterium]|nr:hypothetical protein [Xanthomonadaceae bacterium]
MIKYMIATCALAASAAYAADRFVPPPAPMVVDGDTVQVEREISGQRQIIHIARRSPADFRQLVGDYLVSLECSGKHFFKADLSPRTSPLGSNKEELVFLTLPDGQDANCVITVVDRSSYPWKRLFHAPISTIPEISD